MITAMSYEPPIGLRRAGHDFGVDGALYLPGFLDARRADTLFERVLEEADWQQERITLFGREIAVPRLTAWYGEDGTTYRYSGITRTAQPWPGRIRHLAEDVSRSVGASFNYVLVNRYRDGSDMLGWHADDEADLGSHPVLGAVSVGAQRIFRLRDRDGGSSVAQVLEHGSLLLMWGDSQHRYKHCIPRTRKPVGERLSFTFRLTRGS